MPFADFLATAGSGSVVGNVAEAFGGRTPERRGVDAFNAQLETIYQAFDRATTEKEIEDAGRLFSQAWARAGGPSDERFDKFAERLTRTALNRVQRGELDKIRQDYGPKTTPLTPQVAPEGQGQPFDLGTTTFAPQTTPARNPMADPEGAFRMFQATGAKPEHLENIFKTPSAIAKQETEGRQKEYELGQQRRLENIQLPGSAGEAGITAGMLATPHAAPLGSYMTGLNPQREPSGAALDLKRQGLEIQQQRANAILERIQQGSATATEKQELARLKFELDKAEFEFKKLGSVSETETPPQGFQLEATLAGIAKDAYAQGKTTPQQIKDFALSRNVILEGEPKIEGGRTMGWGKDPSLSGVTGVRAKPKVVTKGPPGMAPGGQPPAGGGQPAPPRPGTVIQGYRFKGGDPASQANWEPVR